MADMYDKCAVHTSSGIYLHATLLQGRWRFCRTLQRLTFGAFLHIAKQKMGKQIVRALPVPATAKPNDKKNYIKKVASAS